MSALDALAPDQRAVVALVLRQGRSYDEIAALLGLPADAVRDRARAGLAALAHDNGLPGAVTARLADYLLGQQAPADAEATRGLLVRIGAGPRLGGRAGRAARRRRAGWAADDPGAAGNGRGRRRAAGPGGAGRRAPHPPPRHPRI